MDAGTAQLVVELYLATLNSLQVVILAWIGAQQHASAVERRRRRHEEGVE